MIAVRPAASSADARREATSDDLLDGSKAESMDKALAQFAEGRIVAVADHELDVSGLVLSAGHCTTEKMAFLIRHGGGLVYAPVNEDVARRLHLQPMTAQGGMATDQVFTVSIDLKRSTTGIAAEERASCCRALADSNTTYRDFVRPGHVFPIIGRRRDAGDYLSHVDAALVLCALADMARVGVASDLLLENGTVASSSEAVNAARRLGIACVSTTDIIRCELARSRLVERANEFAVDSPIGPLRAYAYKTSPGPMYQFAYVHGDLCSGGPVPVFVERPNFRMGPLINDDHLGSRLAELKRAGRGVIVILRDGEAGLLKEAELSSQRQPVARIYAKERAILKQILLDLNVGSARSRGVASSSADREALCWW